MAFAIDRNRLPHLTATQEYIAIRLGAMSKETGAVAGSVALGGEGGLICRLEQNEGAELRVGTLRVADRAAAGGGLAVTRCSPGARDVMLRVRPSP